MQPHIEDFIAVDAVIIGGGIAGLFTLAKLINAGYQAVLLEKSALGSGQTMKSQGIIHGGTKYALLGKQTAAQRQIASMPAYWRDCLAGRGDVDLSTCQVLANNQCMWALPQLSSQVTGFFASRLMKSHVKPLAHKDKPQALQHAICRGNFYALDEPVLNVQSLIKTLASRYEAFILTDCQITIRDNQVTATAAKQTVQFAANRLIYAAGEGNQAYTQQQQLRPLRMVYAKVPDSFGELFVHILAASDKPRLTISSYPRESYDSNHQGLIWYLGGNLAEKGADLSHQETIDLAQQELKTLMPWLTLDDIEWGSFLVNRAEGTNQGKRPDEPTILEHQQSLLVYPTKLVMAPMLAEQIISRMPHKNTLVSQLPAAIVAAKPRIAAFPWQ